MTKDEAKAAIVANGWHSPEDGDEGRIVIHSRLGGIGADWDVEGALALIDRADEVEWVRSIFRHDLAVTYTDDGRTKTIQFECSSPDRIEA